MMRYLQGFFAAFYILYATEILILNDPSSLRYAFKSEKACTLAQQPFPLALALDLSFNFRAIGWSHGIKNTAVGLWTTKSKHLCAVKSCRGPESGCSLDQKPQTGRFLKSHAWKLFCMWLWLDIYIWGPRAPTHTGAMIMQHMWLPYSLDVVLATVIDEIVALLRLLAHTLTLRVLLDGSHSIYCLLSVGLGCQPPHLNPPLFGPLREVRHFQVQGKPATPGRTRGVVTGCVGIWNNVWHDILGRTLMQVTIAMAATNKKWGRSRAFFLFVPFILSGVLHAAGFFAIIPDIRSAFGVFIFFSVQPIGIALERKIPGFGRQTVPFPYRKKVILFAHFSFIVIWFRASLPFLWYQDVLRLTVANIDVPGSLWRRVTGTYYGR
jgi:hypothetical protein